MTDAKRLLWLLLIHLFRVKAMNDKDFLKFLIPVAAILVVGITIGAIIF